MANKRNTKKVEKIKKELKQNEIKEVSEEVVKEKETKKEKTSKTKTCRYNKLIIVIVCVAAFIGLSLLLPSNGEEKEPEVVYDVSEWATATKEDTVVTVLASTGCGHCQAYKPVINELSKVHKFNLYFFELEELSQDEQNVVLTTYELENFTGSVPYTFIVKEGKIIDDTLGYADEETTVEFLTKNGLIK